MFNIGKLTRTWALCGCGQAHEYPQVPIVSKQRFVHKLIFCPDLTPAEYMENQGLIPIVNV
jgi:hypothetical protein